MSRIFLYIYVVLLFAVTALPQAKGEPTFDPKISGTWVLDSNKSDLGNEEPFYGNRFLQISITDVEITVSLVEVSNNRVIDKTTFYTDNRGETNKPYSANSTYDLPSKTKIKKEKIVRRYSLPIRNTSGWTDGYIAVIETYFLSPDRNTLTITKESQSPTASRIGTSRPSSETRTVRRVYKKKPNG